MVSQQQQGPGVALEQTGVRKHRPLLISLKSKMPFLQKEQLSYSPWHKYKEQSQPLLWKAWPHPPDMGHGKGFLLLFK